MLARAWVGVVPTFVVSIIGSDASSRDAFNLLLHIDMYIKTLLV